MDGRIKHKDFKVELFIVFAILVSLGFPGNFTNIFGDRIGSLMEYAAFFSEIIAMMLSSGKNWLEIQLVHFDKKYSMLYVMVVVLFAESLLVTNSFSLQMITCIRLYVTLLFAIWIQEQFEFEWVVELICVAQAIFVFFVLIFMLRYPGEAFETGKTYINALKGLYPSKNSFASELSFGIVVMAFLIEQKRKKHEKYNGWMLMILVQILLVVMCQATGALICLVFVMFVFFLPSDERLPLAWIYIAGNIVFLFGMLTLMPYLEWLFELLGKDATLTGRIPLWNQIISVMMSHHTFTGYGYGMFWRDTYAVSLIHAGFANHSFFGTMTTGAHNMLLEFWLNSGLLGIAVFFAALLYSMRHIEEVAAEKYAFSSIVIAYLMINGLTERCLGGNYDYKMFSLFLVMALCCNRAIKN